MRALSFGLVFLNLKLLFLGMVAGGILVGLAFNEAVAEYFREISVAGLVVVSFRVMFLFTGCDSTGTEDDGIVLIERVATHAVLQFVVGRQCFVIHPQCHLRGGNHAAGGKGLAIAALVKKRKKFVCFLVITPLSLKVPLALWRGVRGEAGGGGEAVAIRYSHKAPCLCSAEIEIAVAVAGIVAPREAVAVLGIVLGVLFVVIQAVENALP